METIRFYKIIERLFLHFNLSREYLTYKEHSLPSTLGWDKKNYYKEQEMFVIVTYDVNAKRDPKVMKTLRKYLTHEQRSVFEGLITPGRLKHLKEELKRIVDVSEDCIDIYSLETLRYSKKESIGKQVYHGNIL